MIQLKDACISASKKDDIVNKNFEYGLTTIEYTDKRIFNFLNLKNQYLSSGSFLIDDLHIIDENEKTSKLLAFKINSRVFSCLCVFLLTDEFKQTGFNEFKKSLLVLKNMPLDSKSEKENKIDLIVSRLSQAKPLYITVDLNDETNIENEDFILDKCSSILNEVKYVFILEKKVVVEENIERVVEENIAQDIQDFAFKTRTDLPVINVSPNEETYAYEKEFENFYSIDTGKEKNAEIKQKVNVVSEKITPKEFFAFTKLLLKNINLYYVFAMVFAFFVGLGAFASVYLLRTDYVPVGVVLIILFVLFMFVNTYIYASTYAGVKKHLNQFYKKVLYVVTFLISTVAGLALSYGALHLMNSMNTFIVINDFTLNDYLFAIISLPILCLICCLSAPLARLYIIWHKFKTTHLVKRKKEE